MATRLFVRKLEPASFVAARVLGSSPYPKDHEGWGLKYLSRISFYKSVNNIPLPPVRKIVPFYRDEQDNVKAARRVSRIARGKVPPKREKGKKGKKKK